MQKLMQWGETVQRGVAAAARRTRGAAPGAGSRASSAQKPKNLSSRQNSVASQASRDAASNQASSGKAAAAITPSTNSLGSGDSGVACRGGT